MQLDLFCKRKGKWGEVPYIQTFMTLFHNPGLKNSCWVYLAHTPFKVPSSQKPNVLDDLFMSPPPREVYRELLPPPIVRGDSLPDHLPLMPHPGSWRHQTPINQLMDLAFGVFNNREAKRIQGQQQKAQQLAAALTPAPPQGYHPLRRPMVRTGSRNAGSESLSCQKASVLNVTKRVTGSRTAPSPEGDSGLPKQ